MTAVRVQLFSPLDPDQRNALARFDEDVRLLCTQAPRSHRTLHARITAAYRQALATAAGDPHDASWSVLVQSVDALLAAAGTGGSAAAARLRRFVDENADALER